MLILRKVLQNDLICLPNILRVTRQSHPAKWALSFTKQGPDIGWYEAWKSKSIRDTFVIGDLANIVAVIKGNGSLSLHFQHRRYVLSHALPSQLHIMSRIFRSQLQPLLQCVALRQVSVKRIMGRGLVCNDVRDESACQHERQYFC
ncbi:hypothetical protein D1872_255340 [compost metagenome]